MWLGSQQQIAKIDAANVLVLSSTIRIQEAARDYGVVIDSCLSPCDHVAMSVRVHATTAPV